MPLGVSSLAQQDADVSLASTELPSRRSFLKLALMQIVISNPHAHGERQIATEAGKPVTRDITELFKLIIDHYGAGARVFELPARNQEGQQDSNNQASCKDASNGMAPHEDRRAILTCSLKRTSAFLLTVPEYLTCYQQPKNGAVAGPIDCNDHSREAGDLCSQLGLVSYHISVCPLEWCDRFRVDSHQFHALRLAEKLFLFFDHPRQDGPDLTLWHGDLQSYISQYRIDQKPVSLIPVVGITKHTVSKSDTALLRLSRHLTESVDCESQMTTVGIPHTHACSRLIERLAKK